MNLDWLKSHDISIDRSNYDLIYTAPLRESGTVPEQLEKLYEPVSYTHLDVYKRQEYTTMLQNQLARGNNGLIKTKYLTFGIDADSIKAAKPSLERIETDILNNFKRLGVAARTLDGKERLSQLHAVFHMDEQLPFQFEWDWLAPSGLSTKMCIRDSLYADNPARQTLLCSAERHDCDGCMRGGKEVSFMPEGKTIGQLMEEMRQKAGAQNYHGHDYMDLQRFAENTRHMIIFDVLTHDSPVGWKGFW